MLARTLPLACLGVLSLLSFVPAACSSADSGGGSSVTPPGAGGDGAAGAEAVPSEGGETTNGAGGGAAGEAAAGMPSGAAGSASEGGAPATAGAGGAGEAGGAGACQTIVQQHALAAGIHVTLCSALSYATNPPSSGEHYGTWADFGVYDFPLPRGYWVHNLEHGAMVVTYNCPQGCADEVAAAAAWLDELEPDATCPAGPPRVLLVPDPELDVRWGASAWGFTARSDCFDAAAFSDFYLSHGGQLPAPEWMVCGAGVDFRADGANTCGAK